MRSTLLLLTCCSCFLLHCAVSTEDDAYSQNGYDPIPEKYEDTLAGKSWCSTWGNRHFMTLDKNMYEFSGVCNYIFSTVCGSSPPDFNIQLQRLSSGKIDRIRIEINQFTGIEIRRGDINITGVGIVKAPYSKNGISIQKFGDLDGLVVKQKGMELIAMWSKEDHLRVAIDKKYKNMTCGLCGNFNDQPMDEFTVQGEVLEPYKYAAFHQMDDPGDICPMQIDTITPDQSKKYAAVCESLLNLVSSSVAVPKKPYIRRCQEDMATCITPGERNCTCSTLSEYSRQLSLQKETINNWRQKDFCSPEKCPGNQVYNECQSPCIATCTNPQYTCNSFCVYGCFCSPGTVLNDLSGSQNCIPVHECPCKINKDIYKPGSVLKTQCSICNCVMGQWNCKDRVCPGKCSVEGGSHVTSFDSSMFRFHGVCAYVLLKNDELPGNVTIVGTFVKCGTSETETCLSTIIYTQFQKSIVISQEDYITVDRQIKQLPHSTDNIVTIRESSTHTVLYTDYGMNVVIQREPVFNVHINVPLSFQGHTSGLCGNFNGATTDDFITSLGISEGTAMHFVDSWRAEANCKPAQNRDINPCSFSQKTQLYAETHCSHLTDKNNVFKNCHSTVDPEPFYLRCIYEACNYENTFDFLCSALSAYAQVCASMNVQIPDWRATIPNCVITCTGNQTFSYSSRACGHTCLSLTKQNLECSQEYTSVDGCNCPDRLYLDHKKICVPKSQCPCYLEDGKIILPSQPTSYNGQTCFCTDGKLNCIGLRLDLEITCTAPKIFKECEVMSQDKGAACAPTCQMRAAGIVCVHRKCQAGCVCPDGLYEDLDGSCVVAEKCSCDYGGGLYKDGEMVQQDCQSCICREGKWKCQENVDCASTCVLYGEGHITTFDGQRFVFDGNCEYTLVMDGCAVRSPETSFRIVTENVICGSTGVTCSRAINIYLGTTEIKLTDGKYIITPTNASQSIHVQRNSLFLVFDITLPGKFTISLLWNKNMNIFIKILKHGQSSICGLCGNYNGNMKDDFEMRSRYVVSNHLEFINSWKEKPTCGDVSFIVDPCSQNPYRQAWAEKKCAIINSQVFAPCHSVVQQLPYYDSCVRDSCGCDLGGDCECLCDAIAAYAKSCIDKGVCVDWRRPDFCPVYCDFHNTHLQTGSNTYEFSGDLNCTWHYQPCLCPFNLKGYPAVNSEGCYSCGLHKYYDPDQKTCASCELKMTTAAPSTSITTTVSATPTTQTVPFQETETFSTETTSVSTEKPTPETITVNTLSIPMSTETLYTSTEVISTETESTSPETKSTTPISTSTASITTTVVSPSATSTSKATTATTSTTTTPPTTTSTIFTSTATSTPTTMKSTPSATPTTTSIETTNTMSTPYHSPTSQTMTSTMSTSTATHSITSTKYTSTVTPTTRPTSASATTPITTSTVTTSSPTSTSSTTTTTATTTSTTSTSTSTSTPTSTSTSSPTPTFTSISTTTTMSTPSYSATTPITTSPMLTSIATHNTTSSKYISTVTPITRITTTSTTPTTSITATSKITSTTKPTSISIMTPTTKPTASTSSATTATSFTTIKTPTTTSITTTSTVNSTPASPKSTSSPSPTTTSISASTLSYSATTPITTSMSTSTATHTTTFTKYTSIVTPTTRPTTTSITPITSTTSTSTITPTTRPTTTSMLTPITVSTVSTSLATTVTSSTTITPTTTSTTSTSTSIPTSISSSTPRIISMSTTAIKSAPSHLATTPTTISIVSTSTAIHTTTSTKYTSTVTPTTRPTTTSTTPTSKSITSISITPTTRPTITFTMPTTSTKYTSTISPTTRPAVNFTIPTTISTIITSTTRPTTASTMTPTTTSATSTSSATTATSSTTITTTATSPPTIITSISSTPTTTTISTTSISSPSTPITMFTSTATHTATSTKYSTATSTTKPTTTSKPSLTTTSTTSTSTVIPTTKLTIPTASTLSVTTATSFTTKTIPTTTSTSTATPTMSSSKTTSIAFPSTSSISFTRETPSTISISTLSLTVTPAAMSTRSTSTLTPTSSSTSSVTPFPMSSFTTVTNATLTSGFTETTPTETESISTEITPTETIYSSISSTKYTSTVTPTTSPTTTSTTATSRAPSIPTTLTTPTITSATPTTTSISNTTTMSTPYYSPITPTTIATSTITSKSTSVIIPFTTSSSSAATTSKSTTTSAPVTISATSISTATSTTTSPVVSSATLSTTSPSNKSTTSISPITLTTMSTTSISTATPTTIVTKSPSSISPSTPSTTETPATRPISTSISTVTPTTTSITSTSVLTPTISSTSTITPFTVSTSIAATNVTSTSVFTETTPAERESVSTEISPTETIYTSLSSTVLKTSLSSPTTRFTSSFTPTTMSTSTVIPTRISTSTISSTRSHSPTTSKVLSSTATTSIPGTQVTATGKVEPSSSPPSSPLKSCHPEEYKTNLTKDGCNVEVTLTRCKGECSSNSWYNPETQSIESQCGCCLPDEQTKGVREVSLKCPNRNETVTQTVVTFTACICSTTTCVMK
uniref:Mucin-6 isoform X4 n=1 Tax=Geotrypetes seraphini TaxID=260995 RepID=A0A6P8QAC6_GEOSA|nr:mucin-6 isoform X4 [Geotrypetes seraphini]